MNLVVIYAILISLFILAIILKRNRVFIIGKEIRNILEYLIRIIWKFIYKIIEIFWIVILGMIILLPMFTYFVIKEVNNISYEQYKELLNIILNSNYVFVIGIIIVVYLFRHSLKKKIEQLKELNTNGVKFTDSQTEQEFNVNETNNGEVNENCNNIIEKNENIYNEVKLNIADSTKQNKHKEGISELEVKIYNLENEIKLKNKIIKNEGFKNIQSQIAKTTYIILIYIYNKYKKINLFKKDEFEEILQQSLEKLRFGHEIEASSIIQFLLRNKIVDTEDDEKFCVTEYGNEFLKFLFERRD